MVITAKIKPKTRTVIASALGLLIEKLSNKTGLKHQNVTYPPVKISGRKMRNKSSQNNADILLLNVPLCNLRADSLHKKHADIDIDQFPRTRLF